MDVLLALLRDTLPSLQPIEAIQLRHVSNSGGEPHSAAVVRIVGPLADRPAPAVANQSIHSGRRAFVAPEESGHADHGRAADSDLDRLAHVAFRQSPHSLRVGGDVWTAELWRDRFSRRL